MPLALLLFILASAWAAPRPNEEFCVRPVETVCNTIESRRYFREKLTTGLGNKVIADALRESGNSGTTPELLFRSVKENTKNWPGYRRFLMAVENKFTSPREQFAHLKSLVTQAVVKQRDLPVSTRAALVTRIESVDLETLDIWSRSHEKDAVAFLPELDRVCGYEGLTQNGAASLTAGKWSVLICPGLLLLRDSFPVVKTQRDLARSGAPVGDPALLTFTLAHEIGHTIGPFYFGETPFEFAPLYARYESCVYQNYGQDERMPYSKPPDVAAVKRAGRSATSEFIADYWAGQSLAIELESLPDYSERLRYVQLTLGNLCESNKSNAQPAGTLRILAQTVQPALRKAMGCSLSVNAPRACTLAGVSQIPD